MRAVTERIRGPLAFDIVFRENDFAARQVWMVGIDARIHDGDDDGRIAESGIPGLRRADELRRPLGDVAVLRRWIRCGVIGIVRDEHRLHNIVEGHGFNVRLLFEPRHESAQRLSARKGEVQRIIVRRFDQRHVRRTHVAICCSLLALVETRHVAGGNLDDSRCCSQMRARYRIRGSCSSAMASTLQRSSSPHKNVDGFWRSSTGLRTVCRKRRISSDVR